jgi:hypothetical protein
MNEIGDFITWLLSQKFSYGWHRIGAKNGKIGVKTVKFGAEIDTNFSTTNQTIKTDIDS